MNSSNLNIPTHLETERLYLRPYQPGDGKWYYVVSQKNRAHLAQYEAENVIMTIKNEEEAEAMVRGFAADWDAHNCFFLGVFDKKTHEFVANIYVGPVRWNLPEFHIGYFVDKDHEGQGYVTEAVKATIQFIFEHLNAHRVGLECDDTNVRSYRVAERCGMIREGHLRENKKHADGTFSGTLIFGLLKSEFELHQPGAA